MPYTVFCLTASCAWSIRCLTLKGAIDYLSAAAVLGHERCGVSVGGELVLLP